MAFCGPAAYCAPGVGAGYRGYGAYGSGYGGGNYGKSGGLTLNNAGRSQQFTNGACNAANQGCYNHRYTYINAEQNGFNANGMNRIANCGSCMGGQACQSGGMNGFGAVYPSGSYGNTGKATIAPIGGGYGPFGFGNPFGPC